MQRACMKWLILFKKYPNCMIQIDFQNYTTWRKNAENWEYLCNIFNENPCWVILRVSTTDTILFYITSSLKIISHIPSAVYAFNVQRKNLIRYRNFWKKNRSKCKALCLRGPFCLPNVQHWLVRSSLIASFR